MSGREVRARLDEAEATLNAIRGGHVDAVVVSGPSGEHTRTFEGATHPYFVLLNAIADGAALLERTGAILFSNRGLAAITGIAVGALRGARFQTLVAKTERASFEAFLLEGSRTPVSREFTLVAAAGLTTPVSIALSALSPDARENGSRESSALMAIVTDLSNAKAAEATRARLLERLISTEDDERRRIARELHDETGQSLTAVLVGLRTLADMAVLKDVRSNALRLRKITAQMVDDIGRLSRGLHPAVLDDKGLEAAASRYVSDYEESFGTKVHFVAHHLDAPPLAPLVAATGYRILQEALTNVARHARAKTVDVEIRRARGALELTVKDDGVGFDASRARRAVSGLGLRGMRERVMLLGGSVQVESRRGKGTMVRAHIPEAS